MKQTPPTHPGEMAGSSAAVTANAAADTAAKGGTVVPPSNFQFVSTESPQPQQLTPVFSHAHTPATAPAPAPIHKKRKEFYMFRKLNILIACEESQAECSAFRNLGHNAYSCDIQPCRKNGNPDWHIHNDVLPLLHGCTTFVTQSGLLRSVDKWDLIIAHPPCTYLCKVSSVQMVVDGHIQWERYRKMILARRFFFECLNAVAPFVAVENPLPMARAQLPPPSCYACPSWYGVKYTKKTLYWLKNLPPLMPEIIYPNAKSFVRCSRGKYRSRTFPQMARAIAKQWSDYILNL